MSNPSFGDLVNIRDKNGHIIACGVVNITPSTATTGYGVDTAYAPGWSTAGESYISDIDTSQVELVEDGWKQRRQKHMFGYS